MQGETAPRIVWAWAPGVIRGVATLHARHYAASHGFGAFFEAKVAAELGGFLQRLDPARDLFRCALAVERVQAGQWGRSVAELRLELVCGG